MQPSTRIQVVLGDITSLDVEAIVNAANESLLGGGGVDGAIHRAAGPELLAECQLLCGCATGQAKITRGYRLKARHVFHTVGPVYRGGQFGELELLRSCYIETLKIAESMGLDSIAFPCISTGVYGYPKADACKVAVGAVGDWVADRTKPTRIVFCCFDQVDFQLYLAETQRLTNDSRGVK